MWAAEEKRVGGLPMPNFSTSFGITKDGELFLFPSLVFLLFAAFADVDPVVVEVLVVEILEAEAHKEHQLLSDKFGGTRNNRVFAFFEIKAPWRVTEARLIEADEKKKAKAKAVGAAEGKAKKVAKEATTPRGGKTTGALEKKKRRGGSGGARPMKRCHLMDALFSESPLRSKGDTEGEDGSSEIATAPEKTPAAPVSAKPAFSL